MPSSGLRCTAALPNRHGRGPIFLVDPDTGAVTKLTDDDHTYTEMVTAPGGVIYALRNNYAAPPHPVRIDPDGTIAVLLPDPIAVMGGSFGGYMANWIAGHTDRFDAIVTHASLWALDQFGAVTDGAYWWACGMTPDMAERNSPHLFVENIATPVLVIHGDKDYRVPVGEALLLWYELLTKSRLPADDAAAAPHRFLYFPSENHWVLAPSMRSSGTKVVFAFLARHVLGRDVELPELLG